METPRRGAVLGIECRRRAARDADAQRRPRLHTRWHGNPERARRPDGSVVWSRNAASDTGRKIPDWGIASSPLVVGDLVIVATAGSLAAYEVATGKPRWFGPTGGYGYSSPHLLTIDGVAQIVLVNGPGAIGVAPADGTVLWKHEWAGDSIVQPAVIAGGDLLIGSGSGLADKTGMLRVTVAHGPGGWIVKERWTSAGLKPYFNDFVVH